MRFLLAVLLAAAGGLAQPRSEIGELNGAGFRISVPEKWNGGLVMYCHGYSPTPGKFSGAVLDPVLNVFLEIEAFPNSRFSRRAPGNVPADFSRSPGLHQKILALLESKPAQAEEIPPTTATRSTMARAATTR
jgi:hypothetical protein